MFQSEQDAKQYAARNQAHVGGREKVTVQSVGDYCLSIHDSSWVDFMRLKYGMVGDSIHDVCQSYWKGIPVQDCKLESCGEPWTEAPIYEVLFLGQVRLLRG